jgi:serine/threonine protein kinase
MTLGRIIGRGGFCTVTEINSLQSGVGGKRTGWMFSRSAENSQRGLINRGKDHESPAEMSVHGGTEMSQKEYMSYRAMRGGQCRYVIKNVAEEWIYQNRVTFLKGTVDLAMEAKFLCALQHPNIMELRGLAEGGPYQENYFIVMDKLQETLPKMMKNWTTRDRQCKGITGSFVGGKKKVVQLMVDRMRTAFDIASALAYLHSLGLVYRDLVSAAINMFVAGVASTDSWIDLAWVSL